MASKKKVVAPVKQKTPAELVGPELEAYLTSVGKEVDRLLERRGCVLDVQPALGANQQQPGTYVLGVVARILVKKP